MTRTRGEVGVGVGVGLAVAVEARDWGRKHARTLGIFRPLAATRWQPDTEFHCVVTSRGAAWLAKGRQPMLAARDISEDPIGEIFVSKQTMVERYRKQCQEYRATIHPYEADQVYDLAFDTMFRTDK
uniref:Uncharacterized protein n=1 Tax=Oryza glumipatula TaxID=40148 RepID=A0A0D9ZRN7_9ORYZ